MNEKKVLKIDDTWYVGATQYQYVLYKYNGKNLVADSYHMSLEMLLSHLASRTVRTNLHDLEKLDRKMKKLVRTIKSLDLSDVITLEDLHA